MEKRRVTVTIGGQRCSFYTDDSDAYISALEQRANEVMRQTAKFSGLSAQTNAILSVIFLTDTLMRAEKEKTEMTERQAEARRIRKNTAKASAEDQGQVSVWDLLDDEKEEPADE